MDTALGRWLLVLLILLTAVGLAMLIPALLRLTEAESSAEGQVPTAAPPSPHVFTPEPTPSPEPSHEPSPTHTPTPTRTPTRTPPPTATPVPVPIGFATHIASEGETLETLALRFGSLPLAIASLNRLPPQATVSEGQALIIPLFAGLEPDEPFEVRGLEVYRGFAGNRIALTFDAGASAAPAASILDALETHGVRVTFFLTGEWAEENPDLVLRMAEEGHELANHTYSHPHLTQLEDEEIREQVLRAEEIIRSLTGQNTQPYLRPPYGDRDQHLLDLLVQDGYISIYWTLDSLDSVGEPKTPEFLFQRVTQPVDGMGNAVSLDGGIVLMHVGSAPTAEALPQILAWYQERGWQIVKVSEILQPPQP